MSTMADTKTETDATAASLTSSRRGPSGWSSMRAKRSAAVARDLDLTESSLRQLGRAGRAPIGPRARRG